MATDLSPHEASTGNGNDVRADLWLFQLRREHATLYEMFTQRDNDIKKLLSENQEHRTTIRNLMNEARRREKLRLESIEQLEGLQSQFVQHQDTLSAFEREIETLRKTPGSAHPPSSVLAQTTRRLLFPKAVTAHRPERVAVPTTEPTEDANVLQSAIDQSAAEIVPTQLVLPQADGGISSRPVLVIDDTPSKRPRDHQIADKKAGPPVNAPKLQIRQNGRNMTDFVAEIDTMATKATRGRHPIIIQQFLMGLDDRSVKHAIMEELTVKDPERFKKKPNGKHNIDFNWSEVRTLLVQSGRLSFKVESNDSVLG